MRIRGFGGLLLAGLCLSGVTGGSLAAAAEHPVRARSMLGGRPDFTVADLPSGTFREHLEALPAPARQRAEGWMKRFSFPPEDLASLRADAEGGVFYADAFPLPSAADVSTLAALEESTVVPASPYPGALEFHSLKGSANVIFLDFDGATVKDTAWNVMLGRTTIQAVSFSLDQDFLSFSEDEQIAITRIWQRVAEDFAPFDVDVTTVAPSNFSHRTAHILITRSRDQSGRANPSSSSGGISYVGVFGQENYAYFRPSWVYYDNLLSTESYIAEASSHEAGHNFGLSHDGQTNGTEYYAGHGSDHTSWGPIMGSGFGRHVTQWSRGDYVLANNTQDDLAILAGHLGYRSDDRGNDRAMASSLVLTGVTNVVATTPETDPDATNTVNRGVIGSAGDGDVFVFATAGGDVCLTVNPWVSPAQSRGGNLDVRLRLLNESGGLVLESNPIADTKAEVQTTLTEGVYFLEVSAVGAGAPYNQPPTGYTAYGSVGQFFVSGWIAHPADPGAPAEPLRHELTVAVNRSDWGTVSQPSGSYTDGTDVVLSALPHPCFRFVEWQGDVPACANPVTVPMTTNRFMKAVFGEIQTTNCPTPHWWLAEQGFTGDYEQVVESVGLNDMPVWASYVSGMNPNDPESRFAVHAARVSEPDDGWFLSWPTVSGRVYSVVYGTNLVEGLQPLATVTNLPWSQNSYTGRADDAKGFFGVRVRLE